MSNRITIQADKLWQLLSSPTTASTYQKMIQLTWQILKETGIFLWLVLCLGLVGFDWLGNTAIGLGQKARVWGSTLTTIESDQIAPETGKAILDLGKTSVTAAIAKARTQLGLPDKEVPPPTGMTTAPIATAEPLITSPTTVTPPDLDEDDLV